MTRAQVLDKLRDMVSRAGTQKALAEQLGISQAFLNDVLQGHRNPSEKLLSALGLEERVEYVKKS